MHKNTNIHCTNPYVTEDICIFIWSYNVNILPLFDSMSKSVTSEVHGLKQHQESLEAKWVTERSGRHPRWFWAHVKQVGDPGENPGHARENLCLGLPENTLKFNQKKWKRWTDGQLYVKCRKGRGIFMLHLHCFSFTLQMWCSQMIWNFWLALYKEQ